MTHEETLRKIIIKRLRAPQTHSYYCPIGKHFVRRLKKHHIHRDPSIAIRICSRCEKAIHDSNAGKPSANEIFYKLGFNDKDISLELLQPQPPKNKFDVNLSGLNSNNQHQEVE